VKLADDLFRLDDVTGANAYLLVMGDGLAVVDVGMPGNAGRIIAAIRAIGGMPSDLRRIVLTHSDPDHSGSAAELRQQTGALVAIHEEDAPALAGKRRPKGIRGARATRHSIRRMGRAGHEMAMRLVFKLPWLFGEYGALEADILLRDRDTVSGLRVMHVPGHTAGSIALCRDDGVVFAGDAIFGDLHGGMHSPPRALSLNVDQALASASRLEALDFTMLLPGHGEPVVRLHAEQAHRAERQTVD
jgi:hydroxyacylglutathione hydrolase